MINSIQKGEYLEKENFKTKWKAFFTSFKGISLKQIKHFFGGKSPSLNSFVCS